jgi:hypothetical protein
MSRSPKELSESLLSDLLAFAKRMLAEHGEFFPFGAYMKADRSIVHLSAQIPGTDRPASKLLIRTLRDSFRELASIEECIATAIAFDVRVEHPRSGATTDAIQVNLAHIAGYSAEVFCPYEVTKGGGVVFGELFAQRGSREIFGTSPWQH